MFKFALTFLPLFRPASIEREIEQTLCLVRRCREETRKGSATATLIWPDRRQVPLPFSSFLRHDAGDGREPGRSGRCCGP